MKLNFGRRIVITLRIADGAYDVTEILSKLDEFYPNEWRGLPTLIGDPLLGRTLVEMGVVTGGCGFYERGPKFEEFRSTLLAGPDFQTSEGEHD